MVVSVGGQTISTTNVTATNWTTYTFSYNAATSGVREIKISFTNDKRGTDGDRNLLVDKVSVACSGTGGSGGTGGLGDPTRVELLHASFTKAALGAYSQAEVAADFVGAPTWNNGLNEGCATIVDEAGSRFLRVTYAGGQFGPAPGGVQFKVPL